ncbi:hypothetical protein [Anaerospora hongkongensis]|uniref:hypothetical protein n=1 Tax=Anaerospora hongkongensis TaxID=244830 RepID=UPI00289D9499|nr:hypothetical protein [Anaerospora hongkongensis]
MPEANDTGATLHSEFNKQAARYETNYTTPITGGELQDILREEEAALEMHSPKSPKGQ